MLKKEFLAQLRDALCGLPQRDIDERLTFYSEMIDDRIEDGLSEAEAVASVGSPDRIRAQSIEDIPLAAIARERIKPTRQLSAWEIVLLILGFPLWFSLLVAAFAVIFSLYISLWAVVISLLAVFLSLAACAVGGVAAAIIFAFRTNPLTAIAMLGAGIFLAGLSIFAFFGWKAATKGTILLAKKLLIGLKNCFIRKEASQ